jgi:hypothetical protein
MAKLQVDEIDFEALKSDKEGLLTQVVTNEGAQSVLMTCHALAKGQELSIADEKVSHVIYVWRGSVKIAGQKLESGSVVAVEVSGELNLLASEDALLIDFHEREPNTSSKSGGSVHIVPGDGVKGGEDEIGLGFHTAYLDAQCPQCDVWFHESRFYPEKEVMRHYHTEDEVIFVCSGELHLGRRVLTPGTALAIAANTPYSFKSGKEGVSIVNFRPKSPTVVLFVEGKATRVLDEASVLRGYASANA